MTVMDMEKAEVVSVFLASVFTFRRPSGIPGPRDQ